MLRNRPGCPEGRQEFPAATAVLPLGLACQHPAAVPNSRMTGWIQGRPHVSSGPADKTNCGGVEYIAADVIHN